MLVSRTALTVAVSGAVSGLNGVFQCFDRWGGEVVHPHGQFSDRINIRFLDSYGCVYKGGAGRFPPAL